MREQLENLSDLKLVTWREGERGGGVGLTLSDYALAI